MSSNHSLCDKVTVELAENGNLLLDVVDLILCIFEVDDLDGHRLPCDLGEALVYLPASIDPIVSISSERWKPCAGDALCRGTHPKEPLPMRFCLT